MTDPVSKNYPSPILPEDRIREILIDFNSRMGASGAAIGGAAVAPLIGLSRRYMARAGARGGAFGGRLGARLFTRVKGTGGSLPVPHTAAAEQQLHDFLAFHIPAESLEHDVVPRGDHVIIGLMGAGAANMNTAVVQALWSPHQLDLTAHALEGLFNQRTAAKAIDRIADLLGGGRQRS